MSHELRTPINTIMGLNELVLRETRETETRERAMDVRSASQILLGLINDVLDFSKIESGMLTLTPARYSFPSLIRDLALLSENRARSKSLDFQMNIQPDLPVGLYGDEIRLRQIMTNLLTNAIKYTPAGSVSMDVSGTRVGDGLISLRFQVSDTGIGIREEDIPRIFIPYSRVDEERNRSVEGSGLGFSIITNLLRLMGSELKLESVYGKGSSFWFDLVQTVTDDEPVGDIEERLAAQAREFEYRPALYAPTAKILVVDDNAMNRSIFAGLLKRTAVRITSVSSGRKCLEQVKREKYDVIFMDHLMPEMDGMETLLRLKMLRGNLCSDAPVVALTANDYSGAAEQYKSMGFDGFLSKPIVPDKLEEMLLHILPPDKLERLPAQAEAAAPEPAGVPDGLPAIEGVNWEFAALHISDRELLMGTLVEYYRCIGGAEAELAALAERLDDPEGLSAYRTRVHSLKSTSAMVGVLSVSELARLLEDAAKSGMTERIRTLDPILRELLEITRQRLRPFAEEDGGGEKAPGDPGELRSLLERLRLALQRMDISAADAAMDGISRLSFDADVQAELDRIAGQVSALEFDGADAAAAALLTRLEEKAAE